MRDEIKILIVSLGAFMAFLVMDTLIDPLHGQISFLELLLTGGSTHELFMRVVILALFAAIGVISWMLLSRYRASINEAAEKSIYLDNILRSSTEYAITTTDKDMRVTYYNPLAERLLGYPARDVIGKTVHEVHTKEAVLPERLKAAMDNVRKSGEHVFTFAKETPSGLVYIKGRVSGIYNERNELVGYANFWKDITAQRKAENEKERLISDLREAINRVETLQGLLPICAYCKKIRDDRGYWSRIETYISKHSKAEFTHSICPDCEASARAKMSKHAG